MNSENTTKSRPRPLSPHLQVYRWLITSTLSILHRLTGVALSIGLAVVAVWLIILAYYPEQYEQFLGFISSPFGKIIMGGWAFALYYHLFNGIRHLFWDIGKGFDLKNVTRLGYLVLLLTAICGGYTIMCALEIRL